MRLEDALYLPRILDKLISTSRKDRAEFGFSQLRLVLCFLRWHNLKEEAAERIHIAPGVIDYIVRLVQHTRDHVAVHLGASPRASLALMRCAKTRALIHGRTHVLPDDVRALVPSVLNHRMILTPEAELDLVSVNEVVQECLQDVPYSEEA